MKWSFLIAVLVMFGSCNEPEEACNPDEWVGLYVGSKSCDGDTEDHTFSVSFELDNVTGNSNVRWLIVDDESFIVRPENCGITVPTTVSVDFSESAEVRYNDGTFVFEVNYFGGRSCTWFGVKQ